MKRSVERIENQPHDFQCDHTQQGLVFLLPKDDRRVALSFLNDQIGF